MNRRPLLLLAAALGLFACTRQEVSIAPEPDRAPFPVNDPAPAPLPHEAQGGPEQGLPKANNGVLPPGAADKVLPVGGKAIVKLLEAGADPKSDFSYSLTKGTTQKLVMAMDLTMGLTLKGQKAPDTTMPRMTMRLDAATGEKNAANEFRIESHLTGVSVDANGGQQEQLATALRPQLEGMKGLGIGYFVNPKGQVRDVKVDAPPTLPAGAKQILSGMSQSFESIVTPLPAEAIGVGARWQVISRMSSAGADILQSAIYTLKARAGAKATVDIELIQYSASDSIKGPNMPAGMSAKVKRFDSSGRGTTQVDLKSVTPEGGNMRLKTGMDLSVQGGTDSAESTIETTTVVQVTRP